MQTEQAVKMAAKLYECRDAARSLFGDRYQERMGDYMDVVKAAAASMRCSELSAATTLANKAGGGVTAVCFLAAAVEITEPSNVDFTGAGTASGGKKGSGS